MNLYDTIHKRYTVRSFMKKEVRFETIQNIISAGIAAPTNDHLREWAFILVDGEIKNTIANFIDVPNNLDEIITSWSINNSTQRKMYEHAFKHQRSMIIESNKMIIAIYKKHFDISTITDIYQLNCYASIWCCIENILLAITSEGLNYGIRIPEQNERVKVKNYLAIPDEYDIATYIPLGYSNEKRTEQISNDIHSYIHINKW